MNDKLYKHDKLMNDKRDNLYKHDTNMNDIYKRRSHDRETRADKDQDSGRGPGNKYDDPPNSRLFIVCGKSITEDQFKESFEKYGEIEEIWVLKDRVTGEPKGVTYIKFSKTSEAALAMEEMNGRCVGSHPRPLKVLIAHSRDQGSRREMNEDERLVRLFVVVPKTMTEAELKENFAEFGDVDYVSVVRDRTTKESKGFAYVKYHRMSHAAKAFEACERSFKPVFADPKPQKSGYQDGGGDRMNGPGSTASASTNASDMLSYMDTSHTNPDGHCRLTVVASPSINQDQLWRLFDLVPGLDYAELKRPDHRGRDRQHKALGVVVFNNPQSANYAKEKLHGFEYPPGQRLIVRFDAPSYDSAPPGYAPYIPRPQYMTPPPGTYPGPPPPRMVPPPVPPMQNGNHIRAAPLPTDIQTLTDTIAQATSLIQAAGFGTSPPAHPQPPPPTRPTETYDPSYCSVKLPSPQPLAPMDSVVAERLFLVCTPSPPPLYALKDVFGRFGNLIDIYLLNGKSCGYAKYGVRECAEKAVEALHGQEVCGSRLKVMPADPQDKTALETRKRPKIMELEST